MLYKMIRDRGLKSAVGRFVPASAAVLIHVMIWAQPAAAQVWEIDLTAATVNFETSAYADILCNNGAAAIVLPGPLNAGLCPPNPAAAGPPGSVFQYKGSQFLVGPFAWVDPSGMLTLHFGGAAAEPAEDLGLGILPCAFGDYASSAPIAIVQGNGLQTRQLAIKWWAEVSNESNFDGPFAARGCADLTAAFSATAANLPPNDYIVRYDWRAYGDANGNPECPDRFPSTLCTDWGIPPGEDVDRANLDLNVGFNGNQTFPGALLNNLQIASDPALGLPGDIILPWGSDAVFNSAGQTFTVDLDIATNASSQMIGPDNNSESARFIGEFKLHLVIHNFITDEPFDNYMRLVPAGGPGPQYRFRVGRYEITNQQYADFLNSAEYDLGQTGLSSNMAFQSDGSVALQDGTVMFRPQGLASASQIVFDSFAPIGTRYTVQVPFGSDPRSYEKHPVVHLSWWGALKFCNWLTLKRGLPASERCYTEGPNRADWHPATISAADWFLRDLNDAEREALVDNYTGFRLPMDNLGYANGWIGNQVNDFNEWYKAAAYDPAAPDTVRSGPSGESIPPDHWTYGFGRDYITPSNANYIISGDPFESDDAFVGMYNGAHYNPSGNGNIGNGTDFQTEASANPWAIYDLSGNIAEWIQDHKPLTALGDLQVQRGGSWVDTPDRSAATYRESPIFMDHSDSIGFRIVQTSCLGDLNFDGVVNVIDLLIVINAWGSLGGIGDITGNGIVNVNDLLAIISAWGPCS